MEKCFKPRVNLKKCAITAAGVIKSSFCCFRLSPLFVDAVTKEYLEVFLGSCATNFDLKIILCGYLIAYYIFSSIISGRLIIDDVMNNVAVTGGGLRWSGT